jgi:hypothetical protein
MDEATLVQNENSGAVKDVSTAPPAAEQNYFSWAQSGSELERSIREIIIKVLGNLGGDSIRIGSGDSILVISAKGMWFGNAELASAKFNVDLDGVGNIASVFTVGGVNNIKIDGVEKRIMINDGTYDRVLLGKLAGKF